MTKIRKEMKITRMLFKEDKIMIVAELIGFTKEEALKLYNQNATLKEEDNYEKI